jgi:hypothetical protein
MALELQIAYIGLAGAVIGGAISSLTSWCVSQSERHKFAQDRIWDIRAETYTKLIATLAAIERLGKKIEYEWSDEAGGETYQNSARFYKHGETLAQMLKDLERNYANASLVISSEISGHLEYLLNVLEAVREDSELSPPELDVEQRKLFTKALTDVRNSAKTELKVPK